MCAPVVALLMDILKLDFQFIHDAYKVCFKVDSPQERAASLDSIQLVPTGALFRGK